MDESQTQTCETCYAQVRQDMMGRHSAWHTDTLQHAVDQAVAEVNKMAAQAARRRLS